MIDVVATAAAYRVAVAELPRSARLADAVFGAIVVVPGNSDWIAGVLRAKTDGASAVVVADPTFVPSADLRRLGSGLEIPLVIERPLLRPDVVEFALAGRAYSLPRLLVIDAIAAERRLRTVAREAIGWARVLGQSDLGVAAVGGALALLETSTGIAVTLTTVATRRRGGGRIRVQALGEVITDIEVEGHNARVTTASVAGSLTAPRRFESTERLAVRRAVHALTTGLCPSDLDELVADSAIVERTINATA